MEGYLKIYDISDNQPKLVTPVKILMDSIEDFGEVIQAKTNSKGISSQKQSLKIAYTKLF